MLKFFLPQPDPKELVRKWQSSLRAEERGMDRQIRGEDGDEHKRSGKLEGS